MGLGQGSARAGAPTHATAESWSKLSALIDIATDEWALARLETRQGRPPPAKSIAALEAAMQAVHGAALWSGSEKARSRSMELSLIEKRGRAYLRGRPIHWSLSKAREVASQDGASAAAAGAVQALGAWMGNLRAANPNHHQLFKTRSDIGGKLLSLMGMVCCSGPRGASGSEGLRGRIALAHGSWAKSLSMASVEDYFMGIHDFGFGTWFDQWSQKGQASDVGQWGAMMLQAASDQAEKGLNPPKQEQAWLDAIGSFMVNYGELSASGNEHGRAQWTWAARFPLPDMEPTMAARYIQAHHLDQGFNPAWLKKLPKSWAEVVVDIVGGRCGPQGREVSELCEEQGRWRSQAEARQLRSSSDSFAQALGGDQSQAYASKARVKSL